MALSLRNTHNGAVTSGSSVLQQQLLREIACLTRQLEHARTLKFSGTTRIYQDMIAARHKMLNNLPC